MNCIHSCRRIFLISLCLFISFQSVFCGEEEESFKAEIQSCSGCSLNSLPEVKLFIFQDVPRYENVVFKHIQGAPPEFVLFNSKYEEIERIPLRGLTRRECNDLLEEKGFQVKEELNEKKEL